MDNPLRNETPAVHFHMRGGVALCGSSGGEGVYHGEGLTCPKCKQLVAISDEAKLQIGREPKPAPKPSEPEPA